ncbi:hypothetical protein ACJ72_08293 [Emergomyces africanus]|uniref:HNH nuclease domain-containing protein n=1 Tax=Emergomyces africanus TaxID=1955775 RepID=A0A1B7NKP6_9EURO|nr:hypothetical protein ACJ72_08293 [Emergomyces africanus]
MNLSAEDIGPNVEFNSDRRHFLLCELEDALGDSLPAITWSCLWLADMSILESKWQQLKTTDELHLFITILKTADLASMVRYWSQRHRQKSTTSSTRSTSSVSSTALPLLLQTVPNPDTTAHTSQLQQSPLPTVTTPSRGLKRKRGDNESAPDIPRKVQENRGRRSAVAKDICRARDASACIVTKFPDYIDVAHIFPFSMGRNHQQTQSFWLLLRVFWSEERVAGWKKAILPNGTETPENLMCLAPNLHRLHTNGRFALQPIKLSEDQTKLTLRFYWLPRPDLPARRSLRDRAHIDDNLTELPRHLNIHNSITHRPVCSGDEIILETSDPINLPLPDIRLLDMQWVLQRLMALSGAAEADGDDLDDDDECVDPAGIEGNEGSEISNDNFDAVDMWLSTQPQIGVPCK